ncbi:MAG TPA: RDD family protein [Acidiphilium sp.]
MSRSAPPDTEFMLDTLLTRDVWPRRVLAFITDMILISILAAAIGWTITVIGFLTLGLGFVLYHLMPLIWPIYFIAWLRTRAAATPGQRLFGLTLRQDDSLILAEPVRPSLGQAIAWTVLLMVSLGFGLLPFLVMFVTRRRRTAHDLLSGLTVVHATALNRGAAVPLGVAP